MPIRPGCLPAARLAALASLVSLAGVAPVHAATLIDFNAPDITGMYMPGESLTGSDYTLTARVDFGVVDVAAGLGLTAPTGNTTQFYFASNDGQLEVARTDGTPFRLDSFSAAFVPLDTPSPQVTAMVAVGQLQGGGTVTAWWSFAAAGVTGYPFADYSVASNFGDLVRVTFRACSLVGGVICTEPTLNNGQFAIDNISLSPVPEPAPAALLALGAAMLALRLRRRAA